MASLGSYIRSAARATFSAYRTVPIRWRLAGGSAALTFVILAGFAAIVGVLTTRQVRGQFNDEVTAAADQLKAGLNHKVGFVGLKPNCEHTKVSLGSFASAENAQIRIFDQGEVLCTQDQVRIKGAKTPPATNLLINAPKKTDGQYTEHGYLVAVRPMTAKPDGDLTLVYARPISDVEHTLSRVRFFLLLGVLGGTVLALLAGLATAQRAVRPIVELTDAAREIERTRDPRRRVPHPEADDEVAELARTLEGMLGALDSARANTESMLDRQREFVADASHELRTPLTSVLANLELLAEELEGEQADTAQAALRSTRRMRRLVGDLLLLARADAKRDQPHRTTDLGDVLMEAAGELGATRRRPRADDRGRPGGRLRGAGRPAPDDAQPARERAPPHAARHARQRTHIRRERPRDDGRRGRRAGIRPELRERIFERFVRGGGDGGRGSGLGLAIVRAVAASHGGTVALEEPQTATGTRFVIELPLEATAAPDPVRAVEPQTSTTTGSTIGRRRSRS